MKIDLACNTCAQENNGVATRFIMAGVREDGLYRVHCCRGHYNLIALQETKFEILFDAGANAVIDGYFREAVTAFAASLERFYEFYIDVIATKRNIPPAEFETTWRRHLSRWSERQLGAYTILYLLETHNIPKLLDDTKIAKGIDGEYAGKSSTDIRNASVHRGYFPTCDEAISFGENILTLVFPVIKALKRTDQDSITRVVAEHVAKISVKMGMEYPRSFMTRPTILSLVEDVNAAPKILRAELQKLRLRREQAQ